MKSADPAAKGGGGGGAVRSASESSDTPLSTAPTSPVSQSSTSYKSGTLTEDGASASAACATGADYVHVQMPDDDDQPPQLSERAAYGEQAVRYTHIFCASISLISQNNKILI